jgi:hypothetical protein
MAPLGWRNKAKALLLDRGAADIAHPGGTLFEHLCRVAELLTTWGSSDDLQAAGLCHACYGTDGFATALLALEERPLLTESIGAEAEAMVYLYASCDRSAVYPRFGVSGQLVVTNRFTDESSAAGDRSARNFLELTAANELDLILVNPESAATWGPDFHRLLLRAHEWLTPQALNAWEASVSA